MRQPCTLKSLRSHGAQASARCQCSPPVKGTPTARALAGVRPSQASAPATPIAEMPITLPMRNSVLALRAMRPRPSRCHEGRPDIRAGYAAAALDAACGALRRRTREVYRRRAAERELVSARVFPSAPVGERARPGQTKKPAGHRACLPQAVLLVPRARRFGLRAECGLRERSRVRGEFESLCFRRASPPARAAVGVERKRSAECCGQSLCRVLRHPPRRQCQLLLLLEQRKTRRTRWLCILSIFVPAPYFP
jgi:hypothetical protein